MWGERAKGSRVLAVATATLACAIGAGSAARLRFQPRRRGTSRRPPSASSRSPRPRPTRRCSPRRRSRTTSRTRRSRRPTPSGTPTGMSAGTASASAPATSASTTGRRRASASQAGAVHRAQRRDALGRLGGRGRRRAKRRHRDHHRLGPGARDAVLGHRRNARQAGYVVLTYDPQGQGRSDTFGDGPDEKEGVPSQAGEPFFDGTEDALDFLLSTPAHPYDPRRELRTRHRPLRQAEPPGRRGPRRPLQPASGLVDPTGSGSRALTRRGRGLLHRAARPPGRRDRRLGQPQRRLEAWTGPVGGHADCPSGSSPAARRPCADQARARVHQRLRDHPGAQHGGSRPAAAASEG